LKFTDFGHEIKDSQNYKGSIVEARNQRPQVASLTQMSQKEAATMIQTNFRGFSARKRVVALKQQLHKVLVLKTIYPSKAG